MADGSGREGPTKCPRFAAVPCGDPEKTRLNRRSVGNQVKPVGWAVPWPRRRRPGRAVGLVGLGLILAALVAGTAVGLTQQPPGGTWLAPPTGDDSGSYTFVAIPDTQHLIAAATACPGGHHCAAQWGAITAAGADPASYVQYPTALTDWILDHRQVDNIQAVLSMGDITNNGGGQYGSGHLARRCTPFATCATQWQPAVAMYRPLLGVIPVVSPLIGNHDYDAGPAVAGPDGLRSGLTAYDAAFPAGLWSRQTSFGGAYQAESMANVWYEQTIGPVTYLFLALEYNPRDAVVAWAGRVIAAHPDDAVIVMTHAYATATRLISGRFGTDPDQNPGRNLWNKLVSKYDNIELVLCGHIDAADLPRRADSGDAGNVVHTFVIDVQSDEATAIAAGQPPFGAILLMRFSADGARLQLAYYSTVRQQITLQTDLRLNQPAPINLRLTQASAATNGQASINFDLAQPATAAQYSLDHGTTWQAATVSAGAGTITLTARAMATTVLIRASADPVAQVNPSAPVTVRLSGYGRTPAPLVRAFPGRPAGH